MGDEWKNVVTGNTAEAEDEVEAVENGETGGGLKLRARKKRVAEEEGEAGGDAGGDAGVEDGQVVLAGEQARSVYLDLDQGIWKCQHCTWMYRMHNSGINHIQNHDGYCQGVIDVETLSQHRFLFDSQSKGIKSSDETNGTEIPKVNQSLTDESMQNHETDCLSRHAKDFPVMESYQHHKDLKVKNQPTSVEECGRILTGKEAVHNREQVIQPDEAKSVVEMDLERILEEQDTHDLYCPNCHSCITKRVILHKRKRTASENISDAKRGKIEPVQADRIANASEIENTSTEPDIFRCLSCFSFFIPTGTGFKLFLGKREENENIQSSQQMPRRNQNWMQSLFELMKHKNKGNGLGSGILKDYREDETKVMGTSLLLGNKTSPEKPEKNDTAPPVIGVLTSANVHEIIEETVKDAEVDHLNGKENSLISHRLEPKLLKEAQRDNETQNEITSDGITSVPQGMMKPIEEICSKGPSILTTPVVPSLPVHGNGITSVPQGMMKPIEEVCLKGPPILTTPVIPSLPVHGYGITSVPQGMMKPIEEVCLKGPPILTTPVVPSLPVHGDGITSVPQGMMKPIEEVCLKGPPILTTPVVPSLPVHGEIQIPLGEQTMVEARLTRQWDVLKAIVYGGLLESIASLGVISSAAGSDVATLNVIALGLANLVGGLLVMIQNLAELKNEQYKSINSEEADRYWELLGKRGYFWLHATVALITFILVGTLPPVIYGFSFRKSDNKEYKLIVVAGASLLCIALLAIGKAHVQEGRKPYLKTLMYYLGLGVGASGLSYAVGMLIKKLLEKLGLFEDSVVATTSFSSILEVTSRTSSWRSY